jgi:raffinose/stachyose/melibiose transport system substrate-binding protein
VQPRRSQRRRRVPKAPAASEAPTASAVSDEPVTLTYYVDDNNVTQQRLQGLTDAYTALHPNVTFEIETHPGGTDGDNLVKTRLATGEMSDIFYYNSGSLFQALNPTESLVDLSGEPFIANMVEAYLPTVSAGDGVYGVPT